MKNSEADLFKEESWLQDLAFLVDITGYLHDLNIKLQGKSRVVTELYDDVKCFKTKLVLWRHHLEQENLTHFPMCQQMNNNNQLSLKNIFHILKP